MTKLAGKPDRETIEGGERDRGGGMTKRKPPAHGGRREGAGRPPSDDSLDAVLKVRVSAETLARAQARQTKAGQLAEHIRKALTRFAGKTKP